MTVAAPPNRKLVWKPLERGLPASLSVRLQEELDRWVGTPYFKGQQCAGAGVDCVRFVEAILQKLYRVAPPRKGLLNVAQDASTHDARTVTKVMAEMLRRYPHEIERRQNVYPGDVIICKVGKGPGHTVIIGTRPWECFHAMPTAGVAMGGVGSIPNVARVIHMLEKERWA